MHRHTKHLLSVFVVLSFLFPFFAFSRDLSFAIIGDTRIGQTESVYSSFIERVAAHGIKTIVHTGDVINRSGNKTEWERFIRLTGDGKTLLIAPGNHDINNRKSLALYEEIFSKPPFYSFSQEDTLFIMLNSEMPAQTSKITGDQLEWLKNELKKEFKYKFVFLHKPVFSTTYGASYGLDKFKSERDALHRVLVEEKVALVAAGHEHLYSRTEKDGIAYVITGGGGAKLLTFWEEHGGFYHYIIAKRMNGGYLFTVYDLQGNIRDEFSIKR